MLKAKHPAISVTEFRLGGKHDDASADDGEDAEPSGDGIDVEGQKSAFKDLREALKAGDDEAGCKALIDFLDCAGCGPEEEAEEKAEGTDEEESEPQDRKYFK